MLRNSAQASWNISTYQKDIPPPHPSFQTTYFSISLGNISLVSAHLWTFISSLRATPLHTASHQQSLAQRLGTPVKKYNVELKLRDTFLTKHQRHNNSNILDNILTNTSSTSRKILACRLYLKVTLLSDITDIKGTSVLSNVSIGTRSTNIHQTSSWPLHTKPNIHSCKLWNRTIRSIYYCTTSSTHLKKHFYLQRWLPDQNIVHRY